MDILNKTLRIKINKIYGTSNNKSNLALFYEFNFKKTHFTTHFELKLSSFHQVLFGTINIYFIEHHKMHLINRGVFYSLINIKTNCLIDAFSSCAIFLNEPYLDTNSTLSRLGLSSSTTNGLENINKKSNTVTEEFIRNELETKEHVLIKIPDGKIKLYTRIQPYEAIHRIVSRKKTIKTIQFAEFDIEVLNCSERISKISQNIDNLSCTISRLLDRFIHSSTSNILKLMFYIQTGLFKSGIKALIGFLFIQMFYSKIKKKTEKYEDNGKYKQREIVLSKRKAATALKALQYSCAAYTQTPISMLVPGRIRDFETKDPTKKHILDRVSINECDIVKVKIGDSSNVSFCAFFDNKNALNIAFRGTCKPEDIFKILNASYVRFLDGFVHEGLYKLAISFINTDLLQLIKQLKIKIVNNKHSIKKHRVQITGHSMGGAVGILVCMILQNYKNFKNSIQFDEIELSDIHFSAITFSVPPIVSNTVVIKQLKNVTVFNYENDLIPHISIGSILDFKHLCISIGAKLINLNFRFEEITNIKRFIENANIYEKLYCPGRIIHIKVKTGLQKTEYVFLKTKASYYGEIRLHTRLIYDHIMNHFQNAFTSITDKQS